MSKNNAFDTVLTANEISSQPEQTRNVALDALIAANPADLVMFRKALIDHKVFWENFPGLVTPTPVVNPNEDYIDHDDFIDLAGPPTTQELRQSAVQLRITLGLKATDDDVLINILTHNPDECRAYLATKPQFGDLSKAHGWKVNEAPNALQPTDPAKNKSTDILSDDAVGAIKEKARDQLLINLINKSDKLDLLNNLLIAAAQPDLDTAANALDFPQALNGQLSLPLQQSVRDSITAQILKLKQNEAKSEFSTYVDSLPPEQLLQQKANLEQVGLDAFKASLPDPFNSDLADNERNWAKGLLGARYLQVALATEKRDLLPALKAGDDGALKAELINLVGNHDYLNDAVVNDNLIMLKKALLQGHFKSLNDPVQLKALDKTENLDKFKEALTAAGITTIDWIEDADLTEMKQWIRSRHFELQVASHSQFGIGAHPQLAKAFNNLTPEKQKTLLDKPEQLRHVVNAKEAHVVEHYWGKNDTAGMDIAQENVKLDSFRGIHNSEVAKTLANFKPPITLSDRQTSAINNALATANINAQTFINPVDYKTLVDDILSQCTVNPTDADEFRKAFGLDATGTTFTAPAAVKDSIAKQNTNNTHLFLELSRAQPQHIKLLGLYLSLDKDYQIPQAGIKPIIDAFDKSTTVKQFIEAAHQAPQPPATLSAQELALKNKLIKELSSPLFDALKNEAKYKQLQAVTTVSDFNKRLKELNDDLARIQGAHKPITEQMPKLEFLLDIDPVHLFNPSFQGALKAGAAEMNKKYKEISDQCDLAVDQLRRHKIALEGDLNSLPQAADFNSALSQPQIDDLERCRSALETEVERIKKELKFYEAVQAQLSGKDGILESTSKAAKGMGQYTLIERKIYPRDEVPPIPEKKRVGGSNKTTVETNTGSKLKFLIDQKIPVGHIAVYDVPYKNKVTGPDTLETFGRFTAEDTTPVITGKKDQITKTPTGRFEITQFPQQTFPEKPKVGNDDPRLIEARVSFSMAMAAEILASMDSPPTKAKPLRLSGVNHDELQYLWTALIVLGESNPKMKFGSDALLVNSTAFDPKNEKGTMWGMSSNSLYSTVFKNYQPVVKEKTDQIDSVVKDKEYQLEARKEIAPKVKDALSSLKQGFLKVREGAQKTIEEEGISHENPFKPS